MSNSQSSGRFSMVKAVLFPGKACGFLPSVIYCAPIAVHCYSTRDEWIVFFGLELKRNFEEI
jgi:hypothetical protein